MANKTLQDVVIAPNDNWSGVTPVIRLEYGMKTMPSQWDSHVFGEGPGSTASPVSSGNR